MFVNTWHIHIKGQVQGVGFRPFIYRLAQLEKISGWVNNSMDGVHIEFNGNQSEARAFLEKILKNIPALATITSYEIIWAEEKLFTDFHISESINTGDANLLLTPDFAMCSDCQRELTDLEDRRYMYPFITCTHCGPRYSIIRHLPYDRVSTTMNSFDMCDVCTDEYHSPDDRRYFSQTNSCSDCAIELSLFSKSKQVVSQNPNEIVQKITQLWREGKIIAIKGIGGYLLTCDATNKEAIKNLRRTKHRPSKPFALMFPDLESLSKEADISESEVIDLKSVAAPIVILELKNHYNGSLQRDVIAPDLHQIGAMLPYTPLFYLLLNNFKFPIVATSGNLSNSPIVFEDKKATEDLFSIAEYVLTNNRNIVVPQDDSVVRYSYFKKQRIVIRRARGYAPGYFDPDITISPKTILATGAMLKSTFSYLHRKNIFVSQYLGDLDHLDTLECYQNTIQHFFKLFQSEPEIVLCDLHPDYPSSQYAENLANRIRIPIVKVQHHIAHFAAVLGEHHIIQSAEPILGVIWDGTGLGYDGNIWGGEFFIFKNSQFKQYSHFSFFDSILGDKMAQEPRISALAIGKDLPGALTILREKFTMEEWDIYNTLLSKNRALKSSSIGRLFDAVASLLNIRDKQSFEGEAAMLLENCALKHFKKHGLDFDTSYFSPLADQKIISTEGILAGVVHDIAQNKTVDYIAAKFHFSLMQTVDAVATQLNIKKIAFSGGVFQNTALVDVMIHHLSPKYELLLHRNLSPNDENISFGQLIYYRILQNSGQE